ncbi:ABC transporter substrate-binding protein [Mannheimia sp. AT1]|uniref:ABC transporter substrate-binding protein n=1 Tax=Mannheimia cairinae TaxID=3025936 RepID=A0ABT5MPT7_9PAST|nr:ABC transporter substrate-binding protein [Mannheimia cairinae]MDD0824187.1 ABC transporter substrate-binding protein [Mannheimia cairinae]MDD0826892.1 ABC transporter substrate-binding protein [Mannheimia cairinae]
MKLSKIALSLSSLCLASLLASPETFASPSGRVVVYCSAQNVVCEKAVQGFSEKYNIKASFIRNSSGSTLAKIDAEKNNPQADVWYGGPFDTHLQAVELGLIEPYSSPKLAEVLPRFQKLGNGSSSVVYMGVLGFGVNTDRLKKLGINELPKCWKDLLDPRLKHEIQLADPQSSGTAYTAISTFIQLWGENSAFDYLKKLHQNISQYPKAGTAPSRNTARGETAIGIGFLQNYSFEKENGAPIELIVPCEGTGYELGGISIIKNARNLENAKLFADWVMSKEAQELSWQKAQSHHIPTNINAEPSPYSLKPADLNLINYDFDKFGLNEVRSRLIDKWVTEVKLAK